LYNDLFYVIFMKIMENKQLDQNSSSLDENSPKWLILLLVILLVWWIWIGVYFFNFIEKKTSYESPMVKENNNYINSSQKIDNKLWTGNNDFGTGIQEIWNNELKDNSTNEIKNEKENLEETNEDIVLESFVAPSGTNILLEKKSLKEIETSIIEYKDEFKNNPNDYFIKNKLLQAKTNKKIIDYFEKQNPDEKIWELYVWDPMSYYFLKTDKWYYFVEIINNLKPDGTNSTKLRITPIEWVDMDSFELYDRYSKDKNYVYRDAEILSWADSRTFVAYDRNYAKDKNHIYCLWELIKWVDYDTFEVINEDYAKDKNHIFTYWDILEWADLETFQIFNDYTAGDKNHIYMYGQIQEWLDPATYDPENPWF